MKPIYTFLLLVVTFFIFSCDDEPIDNSQITAEDPIEVGSPLYNNIEGVSDNIEQDQPVCIDFNYAFTVFIFDETLSFSGLQTVGNDQEFSDFLGSLPEGYSISISYPISYDNEDGETVEIFNNDDLKEVIDPCIEFELIEIGNGNCAPDDCVWRVLPNESSNSNYDNAVFDINDSGFVSFYRGDELYFGSWISFLVSYEYHININLINSGSVGDDLNRDWKVTFIESNLMLLENEGDFFALQKECVLENECEQYMFEECVANEGDAFAEFDLGSYIDCFTFNIDISNSTITFHETIADMENGINAISSPYTNIENPQQIYVRLEDNDTGIGTFVTIQLAAVDCPEEGD